MATSALNPNAPMFVPLSYRQVEDFSDQWWDLVSSSPWFCDYWLRECFHHDEPIPSDVGTDGDSSPTPNSKKTTRKQEEGEEGGRLDLVSIGFLKWSQQRARMAEIFAKTNKYGYGEKAPKAKIQNLVRVNPKPIKQPR